MAKKEEHPIIELRGKAIKFINKSRHTKIPDEDIVDAILLNWVVPYKQKAIEKVFDDIENIIFNTKLLNREDYKRLKKKHTS